MLNLFQQPRANNLAVHGLLRHVHWTLDDLKPVISIPVPLTKESLKRRQRRKDKGIKDSKFYGGDRSLPAVISCRLPELDHYFGQTYSGWSPLPLATRHWHSRKTIGDFFTFKSFRRPAFTVDEKSLEFQDFYLDRRYEVY